MKAVDFYKLPRAIQDRFVGSVMSGFPPAPILATKGGTPTKFLWLGLTGGCFLALVITTRVGYGSLDSALALHSGKALILYAALVFGIAFGVVQAYGRLVREKALPYGAGVYLFPACLIDARSDQFRVYWTQDLQNVDAQGASVRVSFAGGAQFTFPCDPAQGPQIVGEVQAARDRAMHAKATEDPKELVAVDPLHNPRFSSPVGPRDSYDMKLPPWKKLGWVAALGVAAIIAPTLWALRNNGSDKTMYARATLANDSESYRAYLVRGSKFKDEVASILLPRSELRDAERVGTVDALLRYKADHPSSKIANEVAISIRTAMLAELEKAKAAGTLAALDEFAKHYPEHGVEPELKEAIHAVYMRDLAAYKAHASNTKDKAVIPFVERLFAWAESHGGKVEVRFHRRKSESLGRADQFVAKTPSFAGEVSYPSRYFDEKHGAKRENALGKTLASRFDAGLSAEIFDVTMGPSIPADVDALPDVKVPTLFVTHGAEWSGHTYQSQRPRGSYVGVNLPFEMLFVIPGDPKPVKLKAEIFKHAALGQLKDEENIQSGAAEDKVYEAMATDAFEQFGRKIVAHFFAVEK